MSANLTESYLDLVALQYFRQPNARAEVTLFTSEIQRIFDFINQWIVEFDLDFATGDRLDKIGKIVGISRFIDNIIPKEYFSFSTNPNGRTFGQGPFIRLFDSAFTTTELDDNQYRFFIRARIAKNVASAFLVTDDFNSLQDTIQFLFRSRAYVVDNYDMTLTLFLDFDFPEEDLRILLQEDLIPRPQGVRYNIVLTYFEDGTFSFAGNADSPFARTFGEGRFARLRGVI